jgi:Raf kinase inhibitor-like YbhB/YbcL family protein
MNLERPYPPGPYELLPEVPTFVLTSEDVTEGEPMDIAFSQDGDNVSPQLSWSGFPPETKSFVVSCFDPDAPTPAGYWHWTWVNVPVTTTNVPRGWGDPDNVPEGVIAARNDAGTTGFIGAAPPQGDHAHRYYFAVHALDVADLGVPAGIACTPAAFMSLFHTIARATIAPTYQR